MSVADPREQRFDVGVDSVIAADRDAAAAAVRHLPSGLVDRARHVVGGRSAVDASTGDVDRGAGCTQLERDAASRAAARAGDQGHDVIQRLTHQFTNSPITVPGGTARSVCPFSCAAIEVHLAQVAGRVALRLIVEVRRLSDRRSRRRR